jgi:hypothetical protein
MSRKKSSSKSLTTTQRKIINFSFQALCKRCTTPFKDRKDLGVAGLCVDREVVEIKLTLFSGSLKVELDSSFVKDVWSTSSVYPLTDCSAETIKWYLPNLYSTFKGEDGYCSFRAIISNWSLPLPLIMLPVKLVAVSYDKICCNLHLLIAINKIVSGLEDVQGELMSKEDFNSLLEKHQSKNLKLLWGLLKVGPTTTHLSHSYLTVLKTVQDLIRIVNLLKNAKHSKGGDNPPAVKDQVEPVSEAGSGVTEDDQSKSDHTNNIELGDNTG